MKQFFRGFDSRTGKGIQECVIRNRDRHFYDDDSSDEEDDGIERDDDYYMTKVIRDTLFQNEHVVHKDSDVTWIKNAETYIPGFFVVTQFRVVFFDYPLDSGTSDENNRTKFRLCLSLPREMIFKVEKPGGKKSYVKPYGYQMVLYLKDLRVVRFSLQPEHGTRGQMVKMLLQKHMPPFAFEYRVRDDLVVERRVVYDVEREYGLRQNVLALKENEISSLQRCAPHFRYEKGKHCVWKICRLNSLHQFSETYPSLFVVPLKTSEKDLENAVNERKKHRIPILCWADKNSGISLSRSAQPAGINLKGGKKFSKDQLILDNIRNNNIYGNKLVIVDARPLINAVGNVAKGGGFEIGYKNCEVEMMDIQNIHKMRDSFLELMNLCISKGGTDIDFLTKFQETKWVYHIRLTLRMALFCVKCMKEDKKSVLLHCSDGWDRTSQGVCLAQILLDPYYRTLEGFILLIEKEWLAAGHMFQRRIEDWKNKDNSPIFFQYLEAVRCLMEQHPTAFEFNEEFLIFLMDEIYAARFGNFLYDCESVRVDKKVFEKTEDIWQYCLKPEVKLQFLSPFFDAPGTNRVIVPDLRMASYRLWTKYWLRYCPACEIPKITSGPNSKFHYHVAHDDPMDVMQERGMMMLKEYSQTVSRSVRKDVYQRTNYHPKEGGTTPRRRPSVTPHANELNLRKKEVKILKERVKKLEDILMNHGIALPKVTQPPPVPKSRPQKPTRGGGSRRIRRVIKKKE